MRQSDRDLPKTNFYKGIKQGKIMAKEFSGVLLIIATILMSTLGRKLVNGNNRSQSFAHDFLINDWSLLVETMLQWEAYLKLDRMKRRHVNRLKQKHRYIMYLIKKISKRSQGMGLKIMKFHAIMHIAFDILQFGVPMGTDTGSNESHHKKTKIAAKLTQKNVELFESQTARRCSDFHLLELALQEIDGRPLWEYYDEYFKHESVPVANEKVESDIKIDDVAPQKEDVAPKKVKPDNEMDEEEVATRGTRIQVYWDEEDQKARFKIPTTKAELPQRVTWCTDCIAFLFELQEKVLPFGMDKLEIITEHKRKDQIFRGTPQYRGKGGWNDWVLVDWQDEGMLPCEIWCFVNLEELPKGAKLKHGGIDIESGVYAVIECSQYLTEKLANQENIDASETRKSDLFAPILKTCKALHRNGDFDRLFYLADVSAFVEPIAVVPDVGCHLKHKYFHVTPRKDWSVSFVGWLEEEHGEISDDEEED